MRELRREQRLEAKKEEKGRGTQRERDISEKIALGMNVPKSKESQFDARLFNQSEGLSSGFGSEESYDLYDRSLLRGSSTANIYKPTRNAGGDDDAAGESVVNAILEKNAENTAKFKADKEFKGTERANTAHAARTKPVEFEKDEVCCYQSFIHVLTRIDH